MPNILDISPFSSSNASYSLHLSIPSPSNRLYPLPLPFPLPVSISSNLSPKALKHTSFTPKVSSSNSDQAHSNTFQEKEKNLNFPSFLELPVVNQNAIKVPTAPWMTSPLLLPSEKVLNLSKIPDNKLKKILNIDESIRALTEKERGGRGKQAMKKIVASITKLKEIDAVENDELLETNEEVGFRVPIELVGEEERRKLDRKTPWSRAERIVFRRVKKVKVVTKAELSLSEEELKRLRGDAVKMRKWVKVKKAGVTQDVVDEIGRMWMKSEIVMIKFDVPLCRNMDRAQEIVETKTGGVVIWRKKDILVVYRGYGYQSHLKAITEVHDPGVACGEKDIVGKFKDETPYQDETSTTHDSGEAFPSTGLAVEQFEGTMLLDGTLYEREADRLLDGLGPRFIDWWRPKPLPVDADLLPEVVPNFRPPLRLCPPHVRPKLTDDELTYLRKLARSLPTHFVLGRNTRLQGLAAAILKLWEKSHIVKIAVKYGIPNTNNQLMSWELKRLTGGVLILRNKFFIILFRGKDFLPPKVVNIVSQREKELRTQQVQEERARLKAAKSFSAYEMFSSTSNSGTFSEFQDIQTKCGHVNDGSWEIKVQIAAEKARLEKELRKQEHKLLILQLKIERSEKELPKLNSTWRSTEQAADSEMLTEEERQMFQKIGLKMDAILLLGRRGIYDGVIRSIHQHWKHREVVKVITMQRLFSGVTYTARLLEIESGGILVAVEKLRKGHAIIIYRGKNYKRPLDILPENLLTKREAFHRAIEMQRRGSLKFFAYQRQQMIWDLERRLRDVQRRHEKLGPENPGACME